MSNAIEIDHVFPPWSGGTAGRPLSVHVKAGSFAVLHTSRRLADYVIRVCAGLEAPPLGRVVILGNELTRLRRRELNQLRCRIGAGMQQGGLISNQTLRMNLLVPLLFAGVAGRQAEHRVERMLEACGLDGWSERRPADVPADLRQVAVLARALVRRPDLALVDDPFANMDRGQAHQLVALCRDHAATVLMTTYRRDETLWRSADQVTVWEAGNLQDATDEIRED